MNGSVLSLCLHHFYALPIYILLPLLLALTALWGYRVAILYPKAWRIGNTALLLAVLLLIYHETLRMRTVGAYDCILTPLRFLREAKQQPERYRSALMNLFLFLPLGWSLPFVLPARWKHPCAWTVAVGFALSCGVEWTQYTACLGHCEVDDVLMNTLGAACGTLSYRLVQGRKTVTPMTHTQQTLLTLVSASLFGRAAEFSDAVDWTAVYRESCAQTVSLLAFHGARSCLPASVQTAWQRENFRLIAQNVRVNYEHCEAAALLRSEGIPSVVLKGRASAGYYPKPELRTMGDVDLLLRETDLAQADALLKAHGFSAAEDRGGTHVAYHRPPSSTWELHRRVNGVPKGRTENACLSALSGIFSTAQEVSEENGVYAVPDAFHHGMVLLLHTASHWTAEGVGLRHLCDWAVFYASLSEQEFRTLFEPSLRACGLWRFAQLLTLTSVRYLHAPERSWAGEAEDALLESLMQDILGGGNFGRKDVDRFRQIKYIANRGAHTVDRKGIVRQAWCSLREKAAAEQKTRLRVLWDYLLMVRAGERRPDSRTTLRQADWRKRLYRELHLFEP